MAVFPERRDQICGYSCATFWGYDDTPGLSLRFDKPFDPQEKREIVTVESSVGPIHIKLNMEGPTTCKKEQFQTNSYGNPISCVAPRDAQHYSVSQVTGGLNSLAAKVGIVLFADKTKRVQSYLADGKFYTEEQAKVEIEIYAIARKKLEDAIGDKLLYKSTEFYNCAHTSEPWPYCTLYIYDKEMKHE